MLSVLLQEEKIVNWTMAAMQSNQMASEIQWTNEGHLS